MKNILPSEIQFPFQPGNANDKLLSHAGYMYLVLEILMITSFIRTYIHIAHLTSHHYSFRLKLI